MFDIENGAYILRAQPLHKGHLEVIKYMYYRCKQCVVILGSANKQNDSRNPLDIDLRKTILTDALREAGLTNPKLKVITLNDWSAEDDYMQVNTWGRFLFYNIANALNAKHITLFYSDDKEIMLNWFRGTEVETYVDFCFIDRSLVADGVSATKVRAAFLHNDMEYLLRVCPQATLSHKQAIQEILKNIPLELPKQ